MITNVAPPFVFIDRPLKGTLDLSATQPPPLGPLMKLTNEMFDRRHLFYERDVFHQKFWREGFKTFAEYKKLLQLEKCSIARIGPTNRYDSGCFPSSLLN